MPYYISFTGYTGGQSAGQIHAALVAAGLAVQDVTAAGDLVVVRLDLAPTAAQLASLKLAVNNLLSNAGFLSGYQAFLGGSSVKLEFVT